MKKIGIVLSVAMLATLVGCKDADYKGRRSAGPQTEVKTVPAPEQKPVVAVKKCTCAPGTQHTAPCKCGAPDCACVVVKKCTCAPGTKHAAPCKCGAPDCACVVEKKPAAPEMSVYVVQSGDYLAKISKKFNVTIAALRKANPSVKKDIVRVGQKLKIPGKVDPALLAAPAASQPAKARAAKPAKAVAPYTGATKEYVVRSGDTLGALAYGNGITIRQLKALNNLTSNSLRIGQKLKVPAVKPAAKAAEKPAVAKAEAKQAPAAAEAPVKAAEATAAEPAKVESPTVEAPVKAAEPAEAAPAPAPAPAAQPATTDYVVQEGDDITSVSISWAVSAAAIRELNNLGDNDQLKPGQIIKLPADAQQ